jgi:hypothetical protein
MTKLFILLILVLTVTGCGVTKDMQEMKDTTNHLKDLTEKMSDKEDHLSDTSDKLYGVSQLMSGIQQEMYSDMVQESETGRRKRLENMDGAKTIDEKFSLAAKYYWSFEFQLWKGDGTRDAESLELLKTLAVQEFFREVVRFVDFNNFEYGVMSHTNRMKDLYALACALDEVNFNQMQYAKKNNFKYASMETIIEEQLAVSKKIHDGLVKTTDQNLLQWEVGSRQKDSALYLLQLRQEFLTAVVISKAIGFNPDNLHLLDLGLNLFIGQDASFIETAKSLFGAVEEDLRGAQVLYSGKIDVSNRDTESLALYNYFLRKVIHTQEFLKSIGEPVKMDSLFKRLFDRLYIVDEDHGQRAKEIDRVQLVKEFADLLQTIRGNITQKVGFLDNGKN